MNNDFLFDIDHTIIVLPILVLLCLSAVFLIIRANKPTGKRQKIILSLLPGILAVVIAIAVGIAFYSSWQESIDEYKKTYQDDICIDLPNSETKIVIKEWSKSQHTGADVYFMQNENEQFLGIIYREGDWFPFANNQYEIVKIESECFTIRWAKSQNDSKTDWLEKNFEIPNG